jgi:cation diffusion facilitator family transporter
VVDDRVQLRSRAIRRVLGWVLVLNVLVAATKLVIGFRIGSLSLQADGVHSCLDGSSNVVGLIGITLGARPPDRSHPYGHQRFETLAAVGIGLLIGASLIEILQRAIAGLMGASEAPLVDWTAAAAVIVTVIVNLFITRYESRRGRELRSNILAADAQHTASDALAALAVLAGFAGVKAGFLWADPVAALVVAVFIAKTSWMVLRANFSVLTDRAVLDPLLVHRVVLAVDGVRGAHRIRSRGSIDAVSVDLHVHLDPHTPLGEAHAKTHEVAGALRDAFPEVSDVLIHTEPADGRERDASSISPGD